MTEKTLHIGCRVLLVLQILLLAADFAHTDTLSVGASPATIRTHDCGSREIHKALDSSQPCLPCFRNANSIAFQDVESFFAPVVRTSLILPSPCVSHESNVTSPVLKRGPPILTAS